MSEIFQVTIGHPASVFPIMTKVSTVINTQVETPTKVAKLMRKRIADHIENYGWVRGTKMKPSELYFMVYEMGKRWPVCYSENSPFNTRGGDEPLSITTPESNP